MILYVLGFAFDIHLNKVLLIKKSTRTWQNGKLNGIGGKVEPNESFVDAMVREFEEESGINTKPYEWYNFAKISGQEFEIEIFTTQLPSRKFNSYRTITDEEIIEIKVPEVHDHKTVPNVPWMLEMAKSFYNGESCIKFIINEVYNK